MQKIDLRDNEYDKQSGKKDTALNLNSILGQNGHLYAKKIARKVRLVERKVSRQAM